MGAPNSHSSLFRGVCLVEGTGSIKRKQIVVVNTRFNFGIENRDPTWTPDGKRIAFSGYKDGKYAVFWKPLDGSAAEEPLILSDHSANAWFF